eukprot:1852702-Heterocapsa_arctica.AAC.1
MEKDAKVINLLEKKAFGEKPDEDYMVELNAFAKYAELHQVNEKCRHGRVFMTLALIIGLNRCLRASKLMVEMKKGLRRLQLWKFNYPLFVAEFRRTTAAMDL